MWLESSMSTTWFWICSNNFTKLLAESKSSIKIKELLSCEYKSNTIDLFWNEVRTIDNVAQAFLKEVKFEENSEMVHDRLFRALYYSKIGGLRQDEIDLYAHVLELVCNFTENNPGDIHKYLLADLETDGSEGAFSCLLFLYFNSNNEDIICSIHFFLKQLINPVLVSNVGNMIAKSIFDKVVCWHFANFLRHLKDELLFSQNPTCPLK